MPALLINLIVFLVCCLLVQCSRESQKRKDCVLLVIATIQVLFCQTFKDVNLLPDIPDYVKAYQYICRDDATYMQATYYYKMQYGYYLYNKILSVFSDNPLYFTFVTGAVISLPYIFFIKRYSPMVWLSLVIYMMSFIQSSFVLRQYTAMGLCIISFPMLFRRQYLRCLVLWLCAMAIHPTAIFFGFVYGFYFVRSTKLFVVISVVLLVGLIIFIPLLATLFVDNVAGYNAYLEGEKLEYSTTIIQFYILVLFWWFVWRKGNLSEELQLMGKLSVITFIVPLASTFSQMSGIVPRLLLYLTFVQYAVIPYILLGIQTKKLRFFVLCSFLFLFFYLFYFSHNSRVEQFKLLF